MHTVHGHLRPELTLPLFTTRDGTCFDLPLQPLHPPSNTLYPTSTANRRKEDVALVSTALKAPQSGASHGICPRSWAHGRDPCTVPLSPLASRIQLTISNQFMKVQLAKLKADQEKSGKKGDHRVSHPRRPRTCLKSNQTGELQEGRCHVEGRPGEPRESP